MSPALKTKEIYRTAPLCEIFGITPQAIILQFMMENEDLDFTLRELEKNTGIRRHTVSRSLPSLLRFNIIHVNREIGQAELYKFNKDSEIAKRFTPFHNYLVDTIKEEKEGHVKEELSRITI